MKLENLKQPPFNTSLMGVIRGVLDYYGIDVSDGALFGGSGHAFLINIHDQLCPSGPYCWRYDGLFALLRNLGLEMTDLGFFHKDSTAEDRAGVEAQIREHLDQGHPCSFANMDNQLIYGYDDEKLFATQPWTGCSDEVTPPTLTFGSWKEFKPEATHVNFFAFEKLEKKDDATILRDSLRYAIDLNQSPDKYNFERYGIGPKAWDNWLKAVGEHGGSHGNWWNATVWSECRDRAADWLAEVAGFLEGDAAARAQDLSAAYREVSDRLARAADKELGADEKARLLTEAREHDLAAAGKVESLLGLLG